jgi:pSer/pThr/pTyr-binding forkhead associated (FHA) protein
MPKLILSMDGLVLKEIELVKERTSIGRKSDNDIQIDNLAISGHHAVITCILDDAFLEDQNSTNGTFVNAQPIMKHVLRNNDVITLGKYRLKFIVDPARSSTQPSDFVDTAALKPFALSEAGSTFGAPETEISPTQMFDGEGPEPAARAPLRRGVLRVLNGSNQGRELELKKATTTLGKPGRQVAVIARRPEGYFILHVEGEHFPQVNGQMLETRPRLLAEHDIIDIAGVRMAFSLRGGGGDAA